MKIIQVWWAARRFIQDQEDFERDVFFPAIEFDFMYKVVEKQFSNTASITQASFLDFQITGRQLLVMFFNARGFSAL